ncbi:MAG: AAA family ATPase [Chloroflexota bacterium]|nr:AAA family ATPase [Chloroflexota bacterium]
MPDGPIGGGGMMGATPWAPPVGPVTLVLSKVDGIRPNGTGWMARCPAHHDRHASLSVTVGADGRALVYCHAGCSLEAVTGALGIAPADLFHMRAPQSPPARTSRRQDVSDHPQLFVLRGPDGEPVAIHERVDTLSGKRMTWRLADGTAGLNGTRTADLPLFGSEQLAKWDSSRPIIVTEGEKAALALLRAGFRALGTVTGAAGAPSVAVVQALRDHHVILWPDADEPGRKHMHRVAERLAGIAASVRLLTWSEAPEHGDAADLLAAGSAADIDRLLESAQPLSAPGPVLVSLASVQPERVSPVWEGRVFRGKVHLVEGDPDLGKTTAALDLAARVSTGAPMPDDSPGIIAGGVVIASAEDGLADTIRPRLEAAGADLERIVALTAIVDADGERMPGLPSDLAAIEVAIAKVDAALVIIDPLMAYLDATVNSWRDQDVRRALAPLARLAERTGCAIVAIRHLNKSAGSHALYRGGGSIGIIGAARVALLVAQDPDDPERRILATVKNNLAPHPPSLAFRLVGDETHGAARIEWLGESEHGASALLAMPADEDERGALDEACKVLRVILADGAVPAKDAEREAYLAGLTRATLLRARKAVGVVAEKVGRPGESDQHWQWRLAAKALTEPRRHSYPDGESLRSEMSPFGDQHHQCARCGAFADDMELMVVDEHFVHRSDCQVPA